MINDARHKNAVWNHKPHCKLFLERSSNTVHHRNAVFSTLFAFQDGMFTFCNDVLLVHLMIIVVLDLLTITVLGFDN